MNRWHHISVNASHVSNSALFSTEYFSTLSLYRRSLDTLYSAAWSMCLGISNVFHADLKLVMECVNPYNYLRTTARGTALDHSVGPKLWLRWKSTA